MTTVEPQYAESMTLAREVGFARLGLMSNQTWIEDPSRLIFVLSRYKFVSRILQGKDHILEVGCADAFATRIVANRVKRVTAIDIDPAFIADAEGLWIDKHVLRPTFCVHDIIQGPTQGLFDGAYSLDVLEHIPPRFEHDFMKNVARSLKPRGLLIIGMPSLESQAYASPRSRAGHINCKTGADLVKLGQHYFHHCMLYGMNDEVVHTGFPKMAHYLFIVCADPK
jgi:2-polyprenyl-3-methyl-5-hydroxy-6-metoxy-1,4-benzoquinol methylase